MEEVLTRAENLEDRLICHDKEVRAFVCRELRFNQILHSKTSGVIQTHTCNAHVETFPSNIPAL